MPRPVQVYSFSDFSKRTPTAQPPGDRLDAQFRAHADAIAELQQTIAALRAELVQLSAAPKEPTLPTPSLYVGAGGPYAGDDKGAAATSADYAQVAIEWAEHMPDTIPGNVLAVTGVSGAHWSSRWWANRAIDIVTNGGVGVGGVNTVFESLADVAASNIPPFIQNIRSLSHSAPGDSGGASYVKVTASSTPVGGVQSADGAYWKYVVEGPVRLEQFGGKADGVVDNYAAFNIAIQLGFVGSVFSTYSPEIQLLPGTYYFSQTLDLKTVIKIRGAGGADANLISASTMLFAPSICGIIVNHYNTLGQTGQVTPTTGADGSVFEGLQIASKGGSGRGNHGLWMFARAVCRDVVINNFPGNSFNLDCAAGGANPVEANCNSWVLDHCIAQISGGHGLYVKGADANAGTAIAFECYGAGGCGILDASFLGNTYLGTEIDASGANGLGVVSYSGNAYQLISSTPGIGASTTPGTNNYIWYLIGTASGQPAWSSSGNYEPECPVLIDGLNNTSMLYGTYIEGGNGYSHINGPGVAWGGQSREWWTRTSNFIWAHNGYGYIFDCPLGVGSVGTVGGVDTVAYVGGSAVNGAILSFQRTPDNAWHLQFKGPDVRLSYGYSDASIPFIISGPSTTYTGGSSAAQPYVFITPQLALGPGGSVIVTTGTAPPASGVAGKGWIVYNSNPSPGGNAGWICTTAGTNGSTAVWKPFGTIGT
jgi:hypothetical protein